MKERSLVALMAMVVLSLSVWAKPDYDPWEIEFKPNPIKYLIIKDSKGEFQSFWYFTAELSNREGKARNVNLMASIKTDEPKQDLAIPFVRTSVYRPGKLANHLSSDAEDRLALYIRDNLSDETRDLVDQYNEDAELSSKLQMGLVNDLNRILKDRELYTADRFEHVTLSERTVNLAKKKPFGALLVKLNRRLITSALSDCISDRVRPSFVLDEEVLKKIGEREGPSPIYDEAYGNMASGTEPLIVEPGATVRVLFLFKGVTSLAHNYYIKIDGLTNGLGPNRRLRKFYQIHYRLWDDEHSFQTKRYELISHGWERELRSKRS